MRWAALRAQRRQPSQQLGAVCTHTCAKGASLRATFMESTLTQEREARSPGPKTAEVARALETDGGGQAQRSQSRTLPEAARQSRTHPHPREAEPWGVVTSCHSRATFSGRGQPRRPGRRGGRGARAQLSAGPGGSMAGSGSSVVMRTSPHDGVHWREAEAEPELRCPGSQGWTTMEGSSPRDGWVRELGDMSMRWRAGQAEQRPWTPPGGRGAQPGGLEDTTVTMRTGSACWGEQRMAGANKPHGVTVQAGGQWADSLRTVMGDREGRG